MVRNSHQKSKAPEKKKMLPKIGSNKEDRIRKNDENFQKNSQTAYEEEY